LSTVFVYSLLTSNCKGSLLYTQSNLFHEPNIAKLLACHKTLRAFVSGSSELSFIFFMEFQTLIILYLDRLVKTALSATSLTVSKAFNSPFKSEFSCSKSVIFSHNLSALSASFDKFKSHLLTLCSSLSLSDSSVTYPFNSFKMFDSFSSGFFESSSNMLNFKDLILSDFKRLFLDR